MPSLALTATDTVLNLVGREVKEGEKRSVSPHEPLIRVVGPEIASPAGMKSCICYSGRLGFAQSSFFYATEIR
jgi:hypothetical protein